MPLFGAPNVEKMIAKRDWRGLFRLMSDSQKESRQKARQALLEMGPEIVRPLTSDMQNTKDYLRYFESFVDLVSAMGEAAVPELAAAADIGHQATGLVALALAAIGGDKSRSALQSIAARTQKSSALLTSLAASLAGDMVGAREKLPILYCLRAVFLSAGNFADATLANLLLDTNGLSISIGTLQMTNDRNVREFMAATLALTGRREVTPVLLRLLGNKSEDARAVAALALGLAGDATAAAPLRERLQDGSATVRQAATLALASIEARASTSAPNR